MKMNNIFHRHMIQRAVLASLLCAVTGSVWAAGVLQPVDPSAQKLQTNEMTQRKQMVIDDETFVDQPIANNNPTFYVTKIQLDIDGEIEAKELEKILVAYENKDVTFDELQKAAKEINIYLRKNKNYYLATAFYPEQDIRNSIVTMKVVTGTFGKINIYHKTKLSDKRAISFSNPLKPGKEIKTRKIESALENYNNLPGIDARAVMKPGAKAGESDIDIYLQTIKNTEVTLFTDNYASKYSGRYRYGTNIQLNNLDHNGDALTVGGMMSTNGKTKDYWLSYEFPTDDYGSRAGVSFSHMGYELGDWYTRLGAQGKANTLSFYGSTPVIQKSDTFMKLLYGVSRRWFSDEYRAFRYESKKKTDSFYVGLGGAYENARTYTNYTGIYTRGSTKNTDLILNGQSHNEMLVDAGTFHKFNLDAVHVDHLNSDWNLNFNFHGQLANHALDGSEKMSLGGPYGVRAYPSSEGSVDVGYQASAELQYKLTDGLTVCPFFDIGAGTMDKNIGDHRHLMGWGIGVQYMNKKEYYHRQPQWYVRLDWARKIKAEDNYSTGSNSKNQLWFRVVTLL